LSRRFVKIGSIGYNPNMDKLTINRYPDKEQAIMFGGNALNSLLEDNKKSAALLLCSGGSALALLDGVSPDNLSDKTTIAVLDERFSVDESVNNFSQLQKTDLYKEAFDKECNFFGTLPRPGETLGQLGARMEKNLRTWRQENPEGKIFATFGLGKDGHIAGIFPYPENADEFHRLFISGGWVAAYTAAGKHRYPERITTTINFFKQINAAVAYISGAEKRPAFLKLLDKNQKIHSLPAMAFYDIKNLEIFTDLE
jgi:6-phosphogluconolactonase/glucosamine-6-phosphate isomerase/deaminase